MNITATIFAGVNQGYPGDKSKVIDPSDAAAYVRLYLREIAAHSGERTKYAVYPGLAVYEADRGCPHGGEAVGAVLADGNLPRIVQTAETLRTHLKQATISVVSYENKEGILMREFSAAVPVDLRDLGMRWQAAAAAYKERYGVQVSAAMYAMGVGSTIIMAAANPTRVKDLDRWEKAAREVAAIVGKQSGCAIDLTFRDVGYIYLQEPELKLAI